MSMGDHYFDFYFLQDSKNEDVIKAMLDQKLWQTANGEVIKICELETGHIENILGWLRKRDYYFCDEYIEIFTEEFNSRVVDEFADLTK